MPNNCTALACVAGELKLLA